VSLQYSKDHWSVVTYSSQNGKAWAADDKAIDKKRAEIRKKNGGKPPMLR